MKKLKKMLNSWLGRSKSNQNSDVLQEFSVRFNHFAGLLKNLDNKWAMVQNWNSVISNAETEENKPSLIVKGKRKGLADAYNKKWVAFGLALELYRALITDAQRFASEKKGYSARIKALDFELALKIESLILSPRGVLEFLRPLKAIVDNQQLVIGYIKTNYDEVMRKINTIKDKKTADELRRIIILLSNREVDELSRCINDVRSWPYRATYGIKLFIERATLYLIGGNSKYDGETFLGFHLHFKDLGLSNELYKTPEVRRLLTYQKEIGFFNSMSSAIRESVRTQGKWEGFYAFYNNLDKGENYIRKVREGYGNENFAKLLEEFKARKHELPEGWAQELAELSETLVNRAYQLVIEPAANAFIRIFEEKIKKIEEGKASALNNLKKLLMEKDSLSKAEKEFAGILRKKRKKLIVELEEERNEFNALMMDIVVSMPNFESKLSELLDKLETNKELIAEHYILDLSAKFRKFTLFNIPKIPSDESSIENEMTTQALTRASFGIIKSFPLAYTEIKIKALVENKHKLALQLLGSLIPICNTLLLQIEKCILHINSKKTHYTDDIEIVLQSYRPYNITKSNLPEFGSKEPTNIQEQRKAA